MNWVIDGQSDLSMRPQLLVIILGTIKKEINFDYD